MTGGFPEHFDGERFFNPGAPQARGFLDVLRWKLSSRPERMPAFLNDVQPSTPPAEVNGTNLRVTFINHSTLLLQQGGVNILTDPVWSRRVSPFTWAGPQRKRAPGVLFENLPRIDTVLLSHNHYDHLDIATLQRLCQRGKPLLVVPRGVSPLLLKHGIGPVHELDWGESHATAGAVMHAVPALHFSARWLSDRNRTLWCGYMIETPQGLVYFAGDTAFGAHFEQIRARHGAPRVALLPIGAYAPRWFMSSVHMAPEDAIRAHHIVGAGVSVGIHYGTFQLADEAVDTPKRDLAAHGQPASFLLLNNGEALTLEW